ncbi:hypothetical protein O6H91_06G037200 [Diphasiastrum complanatum]|uniref:Uncharacterized protein n=1 Tax=Diphasiastrum complanatum TaxID=34168 RepID=A0ACC2DCJ5_DIPCM|nr:hypothetical protein O6H91_06G037200 [Diphasiastrum complanatum]
MAKLWAGGGRGGKVSGTSKNGLAVAGRAQYQGGSSFTVFSAQGSNPVANCKLCGKGVQKIYDKTVKGYVYLCSGGPSAKLQIPKDDSKSGLQLVHPYLVLQLFVPLGQHFSLELRLSDATNTRRKMYLSTSFSELKTTPLHCQIPLSMIMHNTWLSFSIHVAELFSNCFRVMNFRSIDVIVLGPVCKLRRVFTMRNRLADPVAFGNFALGTEEYLPPEHVFASGVMACVQVLDTAKLQSVLGIEIPNFDGTKSVGGSDSSLSARRLLLSKVESSKQVHVAFGSRVPQSIPCTTLSSDLLPEEQLRFLQCKTDSLGPPLCQSSESINFRISEIERITLDAMKGPKGVNIPDSTTPEMRAAGRSRALIHSTRDSNKSSTGGDNLSSDYFTPAENRTLSLKQSVGIRKKEDIGIKRNLPAMPSSKNSGKCVSVPLKVDACKQSKCLESPPGSPPCGWERYSNDGEPNDMIFTAVESLSFFEPINGDGCEFESCVSLTEGALQANRNSVMSFGQDGGNLTTEANGTAKARQHDDSKPLKAKISRNNKGGVKFYQYELENEFLLREDNSDSPTDEGSEEEHSWSSGSLRKYDNCRLDRCENVCNGNTLSSVADSMQPDGFIVNTEFLHSDYDMEEPVHEPLCSTEELFVVHEHDTGMMNTISSNESILRDNARKVVVEGQTFPSSNMPHNQMEHLELEIQRNRIESEISLASLVTATSASKLCIEPLMHDSGFAFPIDSGQDCKFKESVGELSRD